MKKISFFLVLLFYFNEFSLCAQTTEAQKVSHFIEVTGTSDMEVTPDEIFITITLQERNEGKEKASIEKQESELKKSINKLGIEPSNLTLSAAEADYRKIRTFKKDVLITKSYVLKVNSAEMLSKVYEQLDQINAYDAYVSKCAHSKILDFQKENRIKALKAAKEKVDYLLASIDQKAGEPLQIIETINFVEDGLSPVPRNVYMNARILSEPGNDGSEDPISFKKIKIRSGYHVKYEILKK